MRGASGAITREYILFVFGTTALLREHTPLQPVYIMVDTRLADTKAVILML